MSDEPPVKLNKKGFWGKLNKFYFLIVVAAALLGLSNQVFDLRNRYYGNARVVAEGNYTLATPMPPPAPFKSRLTVSESDVREFIPGQCADYTTVRNLTTHLNQIEPNVETAELATLSSFWNITVKNDGYSEAQGVKLRTPFKGFYRMLRKGSPPRFERYDYYDIDIGTLVPGDVVEVSLWSLESPKSIFNKDSDVERLSNQIKVGTRNGEIDVEYPTLVRGWGWAAFYNHFWLVVILSAFGGLIGYLIYSERRAGGGEGAEVSQ